MQAQTLTIFVVDHIFVAIPAVPNFIITVSHAFHFIIEQVQSFLSEVSTILDNKAPPALRKVET